MAKSSYKKQIIKLFNQGFSVIYLSNLYNKSIFKVNLIIENRNEK